MPTTLGASRPAGGGPQLVVEEALDEVELVDELPFEDEDEDESLDDEVEEPPEEPPESLEEAPLSLDEDVGEPEEVESDRESVL